MQLSWSTARQFGAWRACLPCLSVVSASCWSVGGGVVARVVRDPMCSGLPCVTAWPGLGMRYGASGLVSVWGSQSAASVAYDAAVSVVSVVGALCCRIPLPPPLLFIIPSLKNQPQPRPVKLFNQRLSPSFTLRSASSYHHPSGVRTLSSLSSPSRGSQSHAPVSAHSLTPC